MNRDQIHDYTGDPKHCHACAITAWTRAELRTRDVEQERDKALVRAQRIGDQSDQRIAKLLEKSSVSEAAPVDALTAMTLERDTYRTLAAIGTWHNDCRPNRHMAARELEKSQAVIDKLADTISALTRERDCARGAETLARAFGVQAEQGEALADAYSEQLKARAEAAEAIVARLRDALALIQWKGWDSIRLGVCSVCHNSPDKGHSSSCAIGQALAGDAAGVAEMRAGALLSLEYVGTCGCPTPACTWENSRRADVVDIGARRFIICQNCGAHHGYTGWSLERIQETYKEHESMKRDASGPSHPAPATEPSHFCGGARIRPYAEGCGARLVYENTTNGIEYWRCPSCGNAHWWQARGPVPKCECKHRAGTNPLCPVHRDDPPASSVRGAPQTDTRRER